MIIHQYQLNCSQYVLRVDGKPTTQTADTVALAFYSAEGILRRHGKPEDVQCRYLPERKAMLDAGIKGWADQLVVVEGRFPLEELNRCLSTTGYGRLFLEKLLTPLPMIAEPASEPCSSPRP